MTENTADASSQNEAETTVPSSPQPTYDTDTDAGERQPLCPETSHLQEEESAEERSSLNADNMTSSLLASSLAFSSSTPFIIRILMPVLCLGCHALFYYGQTAPMWKLRSYAEIDVWANATGVSKPQP
jgi:hypothetical protein